MAHVVCIAVHVGQLTVVAARVMLLMIPFGNANLDGVLETKTWNSVVF